MRPSNPIPSRFPAATFLHRLMMFALCWFALGSAHASMVQVYSQTPDPGAQVGTVVTSAWYSVGGYGSDADFYAYDSFILPSDTAITEIDWRGGGGSLSDGTVTGFTVCIFDSIAGGYEPLVTNPQLPEYPLVRYTVSGSAANETALGTLGGMAMYSYKYSLPVPFQASAGHKYWLRVQASQVTYPPSWGMALGTGGDGSHFNFSTGMARFYFSSGDAAFSLFTLSGSTYTIATNVSPGGGGTATGGGKFPNGTTAALVATASPGYAFVNWTENGVTVSTSANYSFSPTRNRILVANFAPAYAISTSVSPSSGGSTTGDGNYTNGSTVTVTAAPAANYAFVNWTENGVPVSVAKSYSFQASADRVLVANFVAASSNLATVYSQPHDGTGAIRLSSWWSPDGYDGDTYSWDNFTLATSSTLTEIRWRGGYSASYSTPVQGFDVSIWPSISAGIQPDIIAGPLKTYNISGNAGETVAGTYGGVTLYDYRLVLPTSFTATAGTKYWIRIRAAQGYFSTWGLASGSGGNGGFFQEIIGGSLAGGNLYRSASGDLAFSLLSQASGYSVSTIASPSEGGTLTGSGNYASGASVTVTASAGPGYTFVNWNANGVPVSSSTNYTFTAAANRILVANFQQAWTIAAAPVPSNGGTVAGGGTYLTGTSVCLQASAAPGYAFVDWTENGYEIGNLPTLYLTADSDHTIVANFVPIYPINATASPVGSGFVSGSGTYAEASTVTLVPTPNIGYAFVNWTEDGTVVSTQAAYTFAVGSARNLTANFAPACTITINVSGGGGSVSGGVYPAGTTAQVVAAPITGYSFTGWTENGALVSNSANYLFTTGSNRSLTANFTPDILSAVFDFDTGALGINQAAPFTQTAGGMVAQFSSLGDSITVGSDASTGYGFTKLTGNYLCSNSSISVLEISFNQPVVEISVSFATLDTQQVITPSTIQLSVFHDSSDPLPLGITVAQGVLDPVETYPTGTLHFKSPVPFRKVRIEVPGGIANYLVDNIAVEAVPELKLNPVVGGGIQLSWPAPVPGWTLEESGDLSPGSWGASNLEPTVSGTQNTISIVPGSRKGFFRLVHP